MTMPPEAPAKTSDDQVVLGVDTHKDVHVAVVLSVLGVLLAAREFPTTRTGYRDMLTWVCVRTGPCVEPAWRGQGRTAQR